MEAWKPVVIVAVTACGRIGFAPDVTGFAGPSGFADAHDAGFADARDVDSTDARGSGAACRGTGTFSNPSNVSAINTSDTQWGTFISPDGLSLLWSQPGAAHEELFISERATRGQEFPAGARLPGAFPDGNARDPTITADLLELYFSSDITGTACIYRATRASAAAAFDPAVELTALCATTPAVGPAISADGLTLAYNSSLDTVAEGDLYVAERPDRSAEFPPGVKLLGLPSAIGFPALSADRLRVWFEQETGATHAKIVSATRASPGDSFSQILDLSEIDTDDSDGDVSLTLDESIVVFASRRTGSWDAFIASRPCL